MEFFARLMDDSSYQTEAVLLDQEEAEHKNIKKFRPRTRILLCQFHVLKAFGRYTNSEDPQAAASLLQKCMEGQTECNVIFLSCQLMNMGPHTKVRIQFHV